jgi:hypothetical protein
MLCCQTSVLHKPRILWRSLLTSSKSAFVNLYALENPLNYEYSVPDHCVVEQAPCSLVCGIGPLALWSMKWLHFPSRKNGAWAMEQLVRACLSFVSRTVSARFWNTKGQPQYGRYSQRGTFHCLSLAQYALLNVFIVLVFQFHIILNEKFSSPGKIHQIWQKCF